MKRYEDLSAAEKERALETCRERIRRYLAVETVSINVELGSRGRGAWCSEQAVYDLARDEIEEMAGEMAREALYPEQGDLFLMIDMEVM